jgi:lysine-N-methylase
MCIDDNTLSRYKAEKSNFKNDLKRGINFKKSKFNADKNGRCAFLNDKGLCEIIINLGEESLCQVCRDHPRFRSFFGDRIETGLGFCCEEATRIILNYKGKIEPILISDDKKENELDFRQQKILEFRENALDIVQDRAISINQRLGNLLRLCKADFGKKQFKKLIKLFLSFERLDKSWAKRLKNILKKPFVYETDENLSLFAEQFLSNCLYRHVNGAEDTISARARTIACVFSWWIIKSIIESEKQGEKQDLGLIADVIRAYSAEVEYSQKNLDKLFKFSHNFIKL